VLAFHLWPTIFAGALSRLQNICRNGVPPRSRTTTPLLVTVAVLLTVVGASFNVVFLVLRFLRGYVRGYVVGSSVE